MKVYLNLQRALSRSASIKFEYNLNLLYYYVIYYYVNIFSISFVILI